MLLAVFRYGGATATGGRFSWWTYDFVTMPGFSVTSVCGVQNIGLFAHEIGHFLGLPHTFTEYATKTEAETALAGSDCVPIFDADRWLVDDTPPDPFIRSIQCNAATTVVLNGQTFSLQRDNAMSYYYQAYAASLSSNQVLRVRRILEQRLDDNSLTLLQDGSSNTNWALGYKWGDFLDLHNDYLSRGWHLHHVNSYVIGGQVRFNGIWHEGNRYTRWALGYLRADFDTLKTKTTDFISRAWTLTMLMVQPATMLCGSTESPTRTILSDG